MLNESRFDVAVYQWQTRRYKILINYFNIWWNSNIDKFYFNLSINFFIFKYLADKGKKPVAL